MELGWEKHFRRIVIPAWQAYLAAETRLSEASLHPEADALASTVYEALREGGAACFFLNHYADIVAAEAAPILPRDVTDVRSVRKWLASYCFILRTTVLSDDVKLLADVTDALKHAHLTRDPNRRDVRSKAAILVVSADGYRKLGRREGKFGRAYEVVVLTRTGPRTLTTILQNVVDAWHRALNWDLPPMHRL